MLLLTLALLALQQPEPAPTQDPVPQPGPEYPAPDGNLDLNTFGGIEAPTQPNTTSSSNVTRTNRITPIQPMRNVDRLLARIDSLVAVRGQEDNMVSGIGLVTGLAGTGDSGNAARQLLRNLLLTRNINIPAQDLASKNIAVVRVEASLPAGVKPGRKIDIRISTIGDSQSLVGGVLAFTELTDVSGTVVYATASGPVTVGGFSAEGESASATRNHVTVGTLPSGGKVEREVPTHIVSDHGYIYLDMRIAHQSFGNAVKISEAINRLYPGASEVLPDGRSIKAKVPSDLPKSAHVAYLSTLLQQEVESDNFARVILNERTGVIVMGGDVRLRPGVVGHGNLTVRIAETPQTSQPGPLSAGKTTQLARTELNVEEENNALLIIPGATTLNEVVDVLNLLGTTPRDLITIIQGLSQAGLLVAEIYRM